MELIYSDEWKKKDEVRKDLTYSPLSKNLADVTCFPIKSDIEKDAAIKAISNYINE